MKKIYQWAVGQSFKKLDPRQQIKNPVMFVVLFRRDHHHGVMFLSDACAVIGSVFLSQSFYGWPYFLSNFAEAVAEGRGKAQADSLKQAKKGNYDL